MTPTAESLIRRAMKMLHLDCRDPKCKMDACLWLRDAQAYLRREAAK